MPSELQSAPRSATVAIVAPLALDPQPTDTDLVARILAGDRWASEALYRRHVPRVFRIAARLLRHASDAEDAVQDAFLEGFARMHTLRDPAKVGSWLVGIAVHKAHRRIRRRRLLRLLGLDHSVDDERLVHQLVAPAAPELRIEIARIDAALDAMGPTERACFVLRHLEGHSLEEVAALVGCSLATAKRRLASARTRLQEVTGNEVADG